MIWKMEKAASIRRINMNSKDTSYPTPEDFNLFRSSDTALGVLESIHRMTIDELPEDDTALECWLNALHGLAWAGLKAARESNRFLAVASDMHRFPATYADIGYGENCVRETSPLYLVR